MAIANKVGVPHAFISNGTVKNGVAKAAAGVLLGISCSNTNAAVAYLRLYDKATAPGTSDTPAARYAIPGNAAGDGRERTFIQGLAFQSGISYRVTTGAADNNDTAAASNEVMINFDYV